MPGYVAYQNVPGYLPDTADDHPHFDTAQEAWQYLADERAGTEDLAELDRDTEYLRRLKVMSHKPDASTGMIRATTPGYDGVGPDLGIEYTVARAE